MGESLLIFLFYYFLGCRYEIQAFVFISIITLSVL